LKKKEEEKGTYGKRCFSFSYLCAAGNGGGGIGRRSSGKEEVGIPNA